jgi:hypothetical protein
VARAPGPGVLGETTVPIIYIDLNDVIYNSSTEGILNFRPWNTAPPA